VNLQKTVSRNGRQMREQENQRAVGKMCRVDLDAPGCVSFVSHCDGNTPVTSTGCRKAVCAITYKRSTFHIRRRSSQKAPT
jgi:hypothetical protein